MDYKITILPKKIELNESVIGDIDDLLFGATPDGEVVFDATEFCNRTENTQFNSHVFMRACKPFIEGFISTGELNHSKMFYQNADGHALIHEQLTYLFLCFVSKMWLLYFNSIVSDAMNNGVAYSDSFVLKQAIDRVPSDVLEKIIESRKQDDEQPTTTGE